MYKFNLKKIIKTKKKKTKVFLKKEEKKNPNLYIKLNINRWFTNTIYNTISHIS